MKLVNIKEKNLIVHFFATMPGTQIPDEPEIIGGYIMHQLIPGGVTQAAHLVAVL
jgi:hypothetical protein